MLIKPLTEFEMSCMEKLVFKADDQSILNIQEYIADVMDYRLYIEDKDKEWKDEGKKIKK
jgi:hypothetical protein